jgi:hypothetical protein
MTDDRFSEQQLDEFQAARECLAPFSHHTGAVFVMPEASSLAAEAMGLRLSPGVTQPIFVVPRYCSLAVVKAVPQCIDRREVPGRRSRKPDGANDVTTNVVTAAVVPLPPPNHPSQRQPR